MFRLAILLVPVVLSPLHGETIPLEKKGAVLLLSGDGLSADRKMRLSDTITLTCVVKGPQAQEVSLVTVEEPDSKLWDVSRPLSKGSLLKNENGQRWEQSITLEPKQPGSLSLPLVRLRFRDGMMVRWESENVEVLGPPPGQARTIRGDLKPETLPEPPPAPEFPLLWLLLGLAGCGVLATGVFFFIRRPRVEIGMTPRQRALRALERLRGMPQPHEQLSLILRSLAEACLGFPATRQTTEEVTEAVEKQNGISAEIRSELETLLIECDRVKFAGGASDATEVERLLGRARDWVERTSPVAAAGSGK